MSKEEEYAIVDGKVQVPVHKWFEWIDKFSRIDDLLAVMIRQNNAVIRLLQKIAGVPVTLPTPTPPAPIEVKITALAPEAILRTREEPDKDYKVFEIKLDVAHTNEPLKLGRKARYIQIARKDADFTYKLNDASKDPVPATLGGGMTEFPGMEITEFYYSNAVAAAGAIATIVAVWKED